MHTISLKWMWSGWNRTEFSPYGMVFEILQQTAVVLQRMEGCHFINNKNAVRNTEILIFSKLLSMFILELIMSIHVRHWRKSTNWMICLKYISLNYLNLQFKVINSLKTHTRKQDVNSEEQITFLEICIYIDK